MKKKESKIAKAIDQEYMYKKIYKCSKCQFWIDNKCTEKECKK